MRLFNGTGVVTMLEYSWYGQVSEAGTPTPAMTLSDVCLFTRVTRPRGGFSRVRPDGDNYNKQRLFICRALLTGFQLPQNKEQPCFRLTTVLVVKLK